MRDLWPWLILLLVSSVVRAAARYLAARRLGVRLERVGVGFGPAILRRTSASGVAWTIGILPAPVARVELREPQGPGSIRRRLAVTLSGPLAGYLLAGVLAAITLLVRGEDHETNVVVEVDGAGPAARAEEVVGGRVLADRRGLVAADRIVAVDGRPTADGRRIRRFLTWIDGDHGEVRITVLRDGAPREMIVHLHAGPELPFGLRPAPDLGVVLRTERTRAGIAAALGRVVTFPAAEGSAIRWAVEVLAPRVTLPLRDTPITYVPSPVPWTPSPADVMGLFALLCLLPWPGCDGGELLITAHHAFWGRRLPSWFEGLFRSPGWGAAMAALVGLAAWKVPGWLIGSVFGVEGPPEGSEAVLRFLFQWSG